MLNSFEGWFFTIGLVVAMASFISWITFARLSMARIERRILNEGLPRPCPWDGPGLRTLWYAWAIAIPVGGWNPANDPLIDVPLVRRYATRGDCIRGRMLTVSLCLLVLLVLLGGPILGFY